MSRVAKFVSDGWLVDIQPLVILLPPVVHASPRDLCSPEAV